MLALRLLRRGLFQRLQWYSKTNAVNLDLDSNVNIDPISNPINTLYADPTVAVPADPAGALREFYKEEFKAKEMVKPMYSAEPASLSLQSVLDVIQSESNANVTTYANLHSSVDLQSPAQIVLQLETVRERFRPFLKDRLHYEGLDSKEPDWIILDLQVARVHIFSPEARIDYGIDEKFQAAQHEAGETPEEILEKIAESMPRRIAGDPSVLYRKNEEKKNPFL
ncbi:hypothetical protein PSACC_01516 [Paramicrosporidium saccamoebae]|uniref:Uncharacterized protein n=1 Tax=Paramicrosporidium saccamoebae TaxID=1246581 RepID=A0A2H9TLN9_9FUNG|nr:hypothetical protein PSACC_01516 [Paramicrosporidium saccamoebae]